jgi:hypothetical protein
VSAKSPSDTFGDGASRPPSPSPASSTDACSLAK